MPVKKWLNNVIGQNIQNNLVPNNICDLNDQS